MGIMRRAGQRIRIRVYTVPGAPDLVAESARRAEAAGQAARAAGPFRDHADPRERDTATWPDPYGPDVTVFGPGPRR